MSRSPETLEDNDLRAATDRPPALTPLHELAHGDGYRWAALDVYDLDPPTWFPPEPAN